ncbi:TonB-dependent receptor [Aestuariibacter sp. AA17]|uniref:TonB-dependent receptor n=1 Tax=Fluctibacter corallii TaxID=2984329 RepID=A0ABT3ACM2_9ALTE|nr:TonB-dependent receptor [Aestuariibacter sp. AA17]MCV2886431.1 TonB-dependent receptor [Aestuariibacter sp. AA17]
MKTPALSLIGLAVMTNMALAQDKITHKDESELEKLVITASPLSRSVLESATPVTIIAGEELKNKISPTLGETLKDSPGVHSSYFGPVSSSPIIRGLDGPRVKVVQNGLDVSDASRVGPDHIVSTETSTATQIEILRGPATLLYGSGAIGGVVNVVDNRLPYERREETDVEVLYLHDTVSDENTVSLNADGGTGNFVWHVDGFKRKTNNYSLPDGIRHDDIHEEDEHDGDAHLDELDSSFIDANGFTVGMGYVTDDTRFAFSYGKLKSDYGIPGHSHGGHGEEAHEGEDHDEDHDEAHGDEAHGDEAHGEEAHGEEISVFGRLDQDRYQAKIDWLNLDGFFTEVHLHGAYTDYTHAEIEGNEVGTEFFNETFESRLWAKHEPIMGWHGVVGVTMTQSDFSAQGEEAFTPPSDTDVLALFVLEEKRTGNFLWQLGARIEDETIKPEDIEHAHETEEEHDAHELNIDEQSFTAFSLSAGVVYSLADNQTVAFNYARSERGLSAAELFANGPHIGTNTYEVGAFYDIEMHDGDAEIITGAISVKEEISNNLDITYRAQTRHTDFSVSVFYNDVDNYVFQQDTGLFAEDAHAHDEDHADEEMHEEEGEALPIYLFRQQDAKLYGLEMEFDWHISDSLRLDTFADYTRAELDNGEDVPRMPPLRISSALHYELSDWHFELGATYYAKQDKVAPGENETDSYTLVNFAVNYYTSFNDTDMTFFLKGNNVTDQEARVHSSFLKDEAPLPGRGFVMGTRITF